MNCRRLVWLVGAFLAAEGSARAVDLAERCTEDTLGTAEEASGRNQWALSCHLITKVDYDCAVNNGYYWTFNSTTGGPNRAPLRPGLSCAGFRKFTMCPAGCFEARQRVLFEGRYLSPGEAYAAGVGSVTTLSSRATLSALSFVEEEIGSYVFGPEKDMLLKLSAADHDITVTHNHPMVDATGRVVPAEEVVVGDTLLTRAGPVPVTSVERVAFEGDVWNIRPISSDPRANVFVAEEFLTGSLRYQNEWASEAARLLLRQTLDVEGL